MNKSIAEKQNNKVINGIAKHITVPVTIGGKQYTPDELKAVFQADIDATNAADDAHTKWTEAVATANSARALAVQTRAVLKSYVVGSHGADAVVIVDDFGFTAGPRPRTVKVKAEAVERSAATRKARHTMGSQQRKVVKGTVTVVASSDEGTPVPPTPGAPAPSVGTPTVTTPSAPVSSAKTS